MTEELNYQDEIEALVQEPEPAPFKTEAEIDDEFLEEYKKLCIKYNRDFIVDARPKVARVNFQIQK